MSNNQRVFVTTAPWPCSISSFAGWARTSSIAFLSYAMILRHCFSEKALIQPIFGGHTFNELETVFIDQRIRDLHDPPALHFPPSEHQL
jgi:hypothetical protein